MSVCCMKICLNYKAQKPPSGIGRYAEGQKRCPSCEIFIYWGDLKCPCCKQQLRILPRSRKGKEKYHYQVNEKENFITILP